MGAGASLENVSQGNGGRRFYCHQCEAVFTPSNDNLWCTYCRSTFIEEVAVRNIQTSSIGSHPLSEAQAIRLANAAFMLRLLETQLREEIETLHRFFVPNMMDENKPRPMTETMRDKLRITRVNLDMICSLPHCPICSEEYVNECLVTQLPCSHFFHDNCVMPWLDMKKTCPICRYEMNDELPSIEELLRFSEQEMVERLNDFSDEKSKDYDGLSKFVTKIYSFII